MESKNQYNNTISDSKEESIKKALLILHEDIDEEHSKVKRPNINVKLTFLKVILVIMLELILLITGINIFLSTQNIYTLILSVILILSVMIFTSKNTIINIILLYQSLASEKLRGSCLFEPTCSEYMILAINKYGIIKGIYKGIKRLLRCHSPNGGIDYP